MRISTGDFQQIIWDFYQKNGRKFPWRYDPDPYHILVSEVMLQQTQVARVRTKYIEFLKSFPTIRSLAKAPLSKVLTIWQGMGYNRRGKYLKQAAEQIVKNHAGVVPNGVEDLVKLSGIGHATACAIVNYAFNKPAPFVETNIRAVYLFHYFKHKEHVSDSEILILVDKTMDYSSPREWFYALTDYGNMLKKQEKFKNIQSKHYTVQTSFEGSRRQVRGAVLRYLSIHSRAVEADFIALFPQREPREVVAIVKKVCEEGLIQYSSGVYHL